MVEEIPLIPEFQELITVPMRCTRTFSNGKQCQNNVGHTVNELRKVQTMTPRPTVRTHCGCIADKNKDGCSWKEPRLSDKYNCIISFGDMVVGFALLEL